MELSGSGIAGDVQVSAIDLREASRRLRLNRWPRGDEARTLWQRFVGSRDDTVRDELVRAYHGYARMMAARYYARRINDAVDYDEHVQLAQLGLLEAIDRFDPELGLQFESFAGKRVAGAIVDGIAVMTELQQQVAERRRRGQARIASLAAGTVEAAAEDPDELFRQLGELAVGLALGFAMDSETEYSGEPFCDHVGYASIELRQLRDQVLAAVRALPDRARTVISMHYLQQRSFAEVAAELGLSAGRVSQLHRDGIERLRLNLKREGGFELRC